MAKLSSQEIFKRQVDKAFETLGLWAVVKRKKMFANTEGEVRCSCYSQAYGQAESNCQICKGTGWVGGYFDSELVRFMYFNTKSGWSQTDYGITEKGTKSAVIPLEPPVNDGDLIFLVLVNAVEKVTEVVEKYKVSSQNFYRIEGEPVAQQLELSYVQSGDESKEVTF